MTNENSKTAEANAHINDAIKALEAGLGINGAWEFTSKLLQVSLDLKRQNESRQRIAATGNKPA